MEQRGMPSGQSSDAADQVPQPAPAEEAAQEAAVPSQPTAQWQPQQPPPWQPPQKWQPPQRSASPKPTVQRRTAILTSAGGLVLGLLIGAAAHAPAKTDTAASSAHPTVTSTVTATLTAPAAAPAVAHTSAAPPPAPTTSAAPKPAVVFTTSGNGIKNTATFTTGPEWSVAYTFDCSALGSQGNFELSVGSDLGNILANALATKGSDTSYEHSNPGSHYLQVNSECDWTLKVSND
jgi:hypothetical protein